VSLKKRLLVAAMMGVFVLAVVALSGSYSHRTLTAYLSVVETGDTAQVMKFTPSTAVDGYTYKDTFEMNADADSVEVSWTAPGSATDVAMVCDSMAAAVNLSACSTYVTAYDSTTFWIAVSDDPGLAFDVFLADTASDTTTTQANVTSKSTSSDTLGLCPLFAGDGGHVNAMYGRFILQASHKTAQGVGLSDSGFLYLFTEFANEYLELDSDSSSGLPCTLRVELPSAAGTDTLFKEHLYVAYRITDTASDTTYTIPYEIDVDYLLFNEK